jgi:small neutral amino acid transporter SnatA (MarC family)
MESTLLYAITVFMGLFEIMNPIANVPIFLGLTSDNDEKTTVAVALRSLMLAFLIVTIFSVAGKIIFDLFGITLSAFRITGGLLVFSSVFICCKAISRRSNTQVKRTSRILGKQHSVSQYLHWECQYSPVLAQSRLR